MTELPTLNGEALATAHGGITPVAPVMPWRMALQLICAARGRSVVFLRVR